MFHKHNFVILLWGILMSPLIIYIWDGVGIQCHPRICLVLRTFRVVNLGLQCYKTRHECCFCILSASHVRSQKSQN